MIPEHFLPKFFDQLAEPANLLSSLHLQPPLQVPIVCRDDRLKPKFQTSSTPVPDDQNLFYLLLFVGGAIFALLITRLFSRF